MNNQDLCTGGPIAVERKRQVFFSTIGYLLHVSTQISSLSFETAKSSIKLGMGTTSALVEAVGKATGMETPTGLVKSAVEIAEWIALTSVETSRFWVDFGLGAGRFNLEILSVIFCSSDIASSIMDFSQLVVRENLLQDSEADSKMLGFPDFLRGLSAWVYLQRRTQQAYKKLMWKPILRSLDSTSDASLLSSLKRFVSFASASYGDFGSSLLARKVPHISNDFWTGSRNLHSFATHTKKDLSAIYHSSDSLYKDAGVYSPKFFVVIDDETKNVVLSLRGTLSFHDLLVGLSRSYFSDLTCENEEIQVGGESVFVHRGILNAAKAIADPEHPTCIFNSIEASLKENPEYGLVVLGHSLGGSIATILATRWVDTQTGLISDSSGLPAGRSFHCFAFGAASCISLAGILSKVVTSITVSEDIVSCLSLGACRDAASAARFMTRNKDFVETLCPQMFGAVPDESTDESFLATRIMIEAQFMNSSAKLYPAGRCIFIDENGAHDVDRVDVLYQQLYLGASIEKHLPHSYESRIQEV